MQRLMLIVSAIVLTAAGASAAPIQWSDNGHWYDVVWVEAGLDWEEARDLANASGGHLVTLTTPEENLFVWNFLNDSLAEGTRYKSYWLGGYQNDLSSEPNEGWVWVTDEVWDYTHWHPSEPNDGTLANQNYLHFWDTQIGEWDDMDNGRHVGGYVIEYEPDYAQGAPVPTPEPSTIFLFASGLIGLAGFAMKNKRPQ